MRTATCRQTSHVLVSSDAVESAERRYTGVIRIRALRDESENHGCIHRRTDVQVVAVLPSDAHGRWDMGVRRRDGWSVTWFDAPVEDLSAHVTNLLRVSSK